VHPLLAPGSWLLEGDYYPTGRPAQRLIGITEVRPSESFPETLQVQGEVRDAGSPSARPVRSTYHIEVAGADSVRFRMDSLPLGTVLTGEGHFNDHVLVVRYASPDRRIQGVESFASGGPDEMRATGVLLADGAPVTCWIARLERVNESRKRP
jgi:hypothetical protein